MQALATLAFSFLPLTTTTTAKQWSVMAKKQLCWISICKAQTLHSQYFSHNYYYYGGHNFAREFMIHNFDWSMSIYGLFLQSEWWLHERGHIGNVRWIKSLPLHSHISNSLFNSAGVTRNQVHAEKPLLDLIAMHIMVATIWNITQHISLWMSSCCWSLTGARFIIILAFYIKMNLNLNWYSYTG